MQPSELDAAHAATGSPPQRGLTGGRFDFDDGGAYCGRWDDGKAHGFGVCTGPKGQGAYAGSWNFGFEVSGVYTWPSGSSYEGQWQNGKRHGLGVETRGRWLYRGEWTQGYKGRYGVRQSTTSNAKYEGTWASGLQDGYGSETYADGGTYQGQWMRGMRHGYGLRTSAPFGLASHYRGTGGSRDHRGSLTSLTDATGTPDPTDRRTTRMDDARGGFVLKASSNEPSGRRGSLVEKTKKGLLSKLKRQRSAGELEKRGTSSMRSGGSGGSASSWVSSVESSHSAMTHASLHTDSNASFVVEDEHLDANVTETYMGEWKNDKRTGFGVSERSDGLRYEGEWFANRKYGYGVTTLRDGTREEGKYKNNVLITSQKRKHMFLMRSAKFRERVDSAVSAAQRASKIAKQKEDIAISRTSTARGKSEQADEAADQAQEDCVIAQATAKQFAPDFKHPGFDRIGLRDKYRQNAHIMHNFNKTNSENVIGANSIPNHIPPTSNQKPQVNQIPNVANLRRPSAAFSKTVSSVDPRTNHSSSYNTDERMTGPPYESAYSTNQDPSGQLRNMQAYGPQQVSNQIQSNNVTSNPTMIRPEAMMQQTMEASSQPYQNFQGRRLSTASKQMIDQRSEWHPGQPPIRRQSILAQPMNNVQNQTYNDSNTAYGRNDLRTGMVHPDGPSVTSEAPMYRQTMDQQMMRQPMEQQQAYGLPPQQNQSGYQSSIVDQNMYRQQVEQQAYRQPTNQDQQGHRQMERIEQDVINGARPDLRRASRPSIDYFDHYQRPPSRDSSIDRYGRRSRQASVEASAPPVSSRAGSVVPQGASPTGGAAPPRPASRGATPAATNGHLGSGRASITRAGSREPAPFEESLLRNRNLGQDISPSPYYPKRTESLYVTQTPVPPPAPVSGGGGRKMVSAPQGLQRKKSLPEVAGSAGPGAGAMSREEVSALGSARREEVRRMHEDAEKLRANPFLYLVSPQVKDWFSRQQLVLVILFINISLGIMFYKLLT